VEAKTVDLIEAESRIIITRDYEECREVGQRRLDGGYQ
jgi:hypothetical protein